MQNPRCCGFAAVLCTFAAGVAGCTLLAPQDGPGVRMLTAEVAVDRGEYSLASEEYRLTAAATKDAKIAEHAARVAFDNGQDHALERTARDWLARDPKSEVARRFEAVALLQLDRRAEAADQFTVLVNTAYPTPAEAFTALNESLSEVRNDVGAARTLGLLAARFPEVPQAAYADGSERDRSRARAQARLAGSALAGGARQDCRWRLHSRAVGGRRPRRRIERR
jgi:Holliday junction resolvase-like predicted endonuclease